LEGASKVVRPEVFEQSGEDMARTATHSDFVQIVANEVSSGIDRAVGYWLGGIELEVVDRSLTTSQRLQAIEDILQEYKILSGRADIGCASA
jgi:hypothetical protein